MSSGGSSGIDMKIIAAIAIIIIIIAAAYVFMGGGQEQAATGENQTTGQQQGTTGGGQEAQVTYKMYTGSPGGIYYPLGTKIAETVSKYTTAFKVEPQQSGASVSNALAIQKGDAQFAMMQSDVAYFAYNGKLITDFEGNPVKKLRALAALYPEPIQIAARADAGVTTIWDLEGKYVAVGNKGSGLYATAYTMLSALGLWDKINKLELGFSDVKEQIQQGAVDVFFVVAGVPTPKIQDLAIQVDLVLVQVPDDAIQKLQEAGLGSLYLPYTIPANSYDFQKEDVQTITVTALLVSSTDVPDDHVYEFLNQMYAHLDEIKAVHERAKDILCNTDPTKVPIPLHPGAEKFYQDHPVDQLRQQYCS